MDIRSVAAAFPLLPLGGAGVLWGIDDGALLAFGGMFNLITLRCASPGFF